MKIATVLDASAVLVMLKGEPGADVVLKALESDSSPWVKLRGSTLNSRPTLVESVKTLACKYSIYST